MIESKFIGRQVIKKPTCPFCGIFIEKPKELSTRMPGEMPVGSCSCGAVYACDETGHNLGSAMIEALVAANRPVPKYLKDLAQAEQSDLADR